MIAKIRIFRDMGNKFGRMGKLQNFATDLNGEITKRYARSVYGNVGNSTVMQNLYNGLRCSAWAYYIFSLQGNSYDLHTRRVYGTTLLLLYNAQRGAGEDRTDEPTENGILL